MAILTPRFFKALKGSHKQGGSSLFKKNIHFTECQLKQHQKQPNSLLKEKKKEENPML